MYIYFYVTQIFNFYTGRRTIYSHIDIILLLHKKKYKKKNLHDLNPFHISVNILTKMHD